MKDAQTAVLFDLDGTIADAGHRRHLLPVLNPESTWDIYSAACDKDLPLHGTIAAMKAHHPCHQVHIISGRSDSAYKQTWAWLVRKDVRYDVLRLRSDSDVRYASGPLANAMFKVDYIRQLQQEQYVKVILFYEDWPEVGEIIEKETGVPVLLVRNTEWS